MVDSSAKVHRTESCYFYLLVNLCALRSQPLLKNDEALQPETQHAPDSFHENISHNSGRVWKAIKLFGVEMSPDNVAVAMVYFVQGILGLSRLAVSFFLKDDLHLDPAEVGDPFQAY
eukprot:Gb_14179 [translate_table: standard]